MIRVRPGQATQATFGLRVLAPRGKSLATDVYLPSTGSRPAPALVVRTPFGKFSHLDEASAWASLGYAVVVQDVRGRYDSDGQAEHADQGMEDLAHDSAATLEWVTRQVWCDGRLIVAGQSAEAAFAWAGALARPDAVGAIVSVAARTPIGDPLFSGAGPRGLPRLEDELWWRTTFATGRTVAGRGYQDAIASQPRLLATLPVADLVRAGGPAVPGWERLCDGAQPPALAIEEAARLEVPVQHVTSWFDRDAELSIRAFGANENGCRPQPRRALVSGPWAFATTTRLAEGCTLDLGSRACTPPAAFTAAWLRSLAGGDGEAACQGSAVDAYVVGADEWVTAGSWPPAATSTVAMFAGPGGSLGVSPCMHTGECAFVDDPSDPFPSGDHGGDHSSTLGRDGAATFVSAPLASPLRWCGSPVVVVAGRSDSPADWFARLLRVRPTGQASLLGEAAGDEPNKGAEDQEGVVVRMAQSFVELAAGERLALQVSGSCFPRWARNLHTGADRLHTARWATARQWVRWGGDAPTRVELPQVGQ